MCISCDLNKLAVLVLTALAVIIAGIFVCSGGMELLSAMEQSGGGAVLIFDAGHGGEDGGAVSRNGTRESVLNLDIALKCAALSDFLGTDSLLTRDSEELDYPDGCTTIAKRKSYDIRRRAELVNETENALLVSIHQNCFPQTSPRGPQVFFGAEPGSRELAELIQTELNSGLYPENRRLAAAVNKDVYLMNNVKRPALLVECGFISNPGDEALLKTDAYRKKLALVISGCCIKFTDELNCEA